MAWAYYLLLLATGVIGLALTVYTLPGLWVLLGGAAIFAALTRGLFLTWWELLILLGLALAAEVGEFFFGGAGAKKAGGSTWGVVGAVVGAILGGLFLTAFIPIAAPFSTVIGICLGAGAGAAAVEFVLGKPALQSLRIGLGAAKGRLLGIVGKFMIGLAMFALTAVAAFPVNCRHTPAAARGPTTAAATRPVR